MYLKDFTEYLREEKRMAGNSLQAYSSDVREFKSFEEARGIERIEDASTTEVVAYLHSLKSDGKSASTVNRKLSSVRTYFAYLQNRGIIARNPAVDIRSPKVERKEISYLTLDEIERIFECTDDTTKGIRDKAILEVMYATGIRATELIEANIENINLKMGFIACSTENERARIVPLGVPSRQALEQYISSARRIMIGEGSEENALFVNYSGERISRQGLWKVLKEYGEKAELSQKLTPNILRNTFAIHMLQNGADLKTLQELMGYEDISAVQAYLAAMKTRIKDVYDRTHPRAK